ncbi:molybdopterin molybdotransferase MoeA [Streptomyces sp. HMX112]|uniref:molybdopterin molybdotransferase MoeA n=1 Tax=Streptomyces sp. HMX112 TaxID=3390850 RepID=UPI003A80C581
MTDREVDGVDEALALVGAPARRPTRRPAGRPAASPDPGLDQDGHRAMTWADARAVAARAGRAAPARSRRTALGQALGQVLAEPLTALTDLPPFDTSAMDGWAVAGPGPWRVRAGGSVLAGHGEADALPDGVAVRIATGARVPPGTTGVIRSEHAHVAQVRAAHPHAESDHPGSTPPAPGSRDAARIHRDRLDPASVGPGLPGPGPVDAGPLRPARTEAGRTPADDHTGPGPVPGEHGRPRPARAEPASAGLLRARRPVLPGQDIRPRGQECRSGDQLLPAGALVTPAVLGLAAAAGYDELRTVERPRVEILVLGDELLTAGLPHGGLIRDALGPMLGPWLRALGVDVLATRRIGDDADALYAAVTGSEADLVVTTGGTASGPVDHVHPVLRRAGAELLVDGVKVRPGHPMLLARLTTSRHLVGLPGNPLAAVSGLLTLAEPLLRGRAGRPVPDPYRAPVRDEVHGHPYDTRLVPVVRRDGRLVPLHYNGPAMLRGIATADGLAVVPPGGARRGDVLEVLALPWSSPSEGCFT